MKGAGQLAKKIKRAESSKKAKIKKTKSSSLKPKSKKKPAKTKAANTPLKKLGKGLKEISHLFLSSSKGAIIKPMPKKIKSASRKKKTSSKDNKRAAKTQKNNKAVSKSSKTKIKKTEVMQMPAPKKTETMSRKAPKSAKNNGTVKGRRKSKAQADKKSGLGPISELKSLFKAKKTGASQPKMNVHPEQVIEESKFFTGQPKVKTEIAQKQFYDLPEGYGDTHIVIQVRDPYWVHAYWEVAAEKVHGLSQELGNLMNGARRILRVYDVTDIVFDGNNANKFFDIKINDYAQNWYINVGEPGRGYCVDIGYLLADGRFVVLARSNFVTTPIDGPSWITDEEWMIVEDDFNKLYGLSAGLGIGLSSMELRKQIGERMRNLSSGLISSPGAREKVSGRKFWLKVQTELIVYGATEPTATVSVQGKQIKLNKDGTFSLRFALPDGQQVIPVKAVSEDQVEEHVITPIVKKRTE